MFLNEFNQPVNEGPNDPHIFKAIFMAGSPGAGKTTIAKQLFSGTGLKVLNVDNFHNLAKINNKEINHKRFHNLASKQRDIYQLGRLGLLIDGTARRIDRTEAIKEKLDELGYDSIMVFVNTDLETCLQRAEEREQGLGDNRHIDPEIIKQFWKQTQKNLGLLQNIFGQNAFYLIDNSHDANTSIVSRRIHKWLDQPSNNHISKEWFKTLKK